jgi:dihydrofolate reductase
VRKILGSTLISLDGVIEDPATWAGDFLSEEFQAAAIERLSQCDAMVMGRGTYEVLARDWTGQTGEFANAINGIRKYVFSSTLQKTDWNNSELIRGNAVNEIRALKERPGVAIALYGHGRLAQSLLEHDLLDELQFAVFPLFLGCGRLLFRADENARTDLMNSRTLPNGVIISRYRVTRSPD